MSSHATFGRLGLLATLYFAQGMPYGFFVQGLPVMLRDRGYSLSSIGLASLLALPWALKFLWAPIVDTRYWARLGRRRTWILSMQLAGTTTLLSLAIAPTASDSIPIVMTAMFVLNLIAATQDVATDGMAVELLPPHERGFANGVQVAGYRVGMIVGGGVLLGFSAELGSRGMYGMMAALTMLSSVPILTIRETRPVATVDVAPAVHWLRLPGSWRLIGLLFAYKAGESFATGMLRPYLRDIGLKLPDIAWLLGTVGFVSGMLGALVGGSLVGVIGRRRALIAFGIGQVITVAGYAQLALGIPTYAELYVWCGVEHFASGMATAALFTCMMDWSRPTSSGTDYTVQASTVVIATGSAAVLSGFSAEALDYPAHFALAAVLCAIAVGCVVWLFPRKEAT